MKTLVLGLGNELYGDDGVGIHAIRWLKEDLRKGHLRIRDEVDFDECSLSGLALLDVIVGYDQLLLIDTIKRENPNPGKIHLLEEKDLRAVPGPSPHYVSIPQTIQMGRSLGLHVPSSIRVVAVEAKNMYHLGEGLSEAMKKCLPRIVERVKKLLTEEARSG